MINKKKFEDVEETASDLIFKYKIDEPAIPIEILAQNEGLTVTPYDFGDDVSGVLVIKDNKGVIGYNKSHSKVRQRFTIAHELGHYLLHKGTSKKEEVFVDKDFIIKFRNKENSYDKNEARQEIEANAFAAALLMPKAFLFVEFEQNDYSNLSEADLISRLAKKFNVSVLAMTYRLANLNLFH